MHVTEHEEHLVPLGAFSKNSWLVNKDNVNLARTRPPQKLVSVKDQDRTISFDLQRTAIIVVDMQNDFCHPDGWLASIGVDIEPCRKPIDPLGVLLPKLRAVNVPIIWLNWGNRPDKANLPPSVLHVYNPDGRSVGIGDELPNTNSKVLQEGSLSADIVQELEPQPHDIKISKYRMTGFPDTVLEATLRNLDVSTLLFAGVNLDQCVYNTLTDAVSLGFDAILLEDCSATSSPQFCVDATYYNVRQCYGFVCRGDDICQNIEDMT